MRGSMRLALLPLVVSIAGGAPTVALACVINDTASLSANGYPAHKEIAWTSGSSQVPFSFSRVYGAGSTIQFSENLNDLRATLSARELSQPFLWRWGDSSYSIARTPTHIFRRPGTYIILVSVNPSLQDSGAYAPFDQVRMRIVPPSEVWRDNLPQDALDVINFAVAWSMRLLLAAGAVALFTFMGRDLICERRRSRARSGTRRTVDAGTGPTPLQ